MHDNTLSKKIGGNWHKIRTWKDWIVGHKSGGFVILNANIDANLPGTKEYYIPFYSYSGFTIEGDALLIRDKQGNFFRMDLIALLETDVPPPLEIATGFSPGENEEAATNHIDRLNGLLEEPRALDADDRITAVAYTQKGIDFFQTGSCAKANHFDFPGYSFIDGIKLRGDKLYIADVFGLRILDIADLDNIKLNDEFTVFKGWPKDAAVYGDYLLAADVLGIKIYHKKKDFALVGKIESNRNRIAKVVTSGNYAFLSCEAMGLKIADLSDIANPRLVGGILLPGGTWDCAVHDGFVYLAAFTGGLLKIDCSEPGNLKQVGSYWAEGEIIGVHVGERAVYAACSHDGFKIFDHQLNLISTVKGIPGRCWTILELDGYLFVAAGNSGVHIYDVKRLDAPVPVNRVKTTEARDMVIDDGSLYIADGQNGALVYDIADIHDIPYVKRIPSSAFTRGIMVDEEYIYKSDGDGGLEVHNK